MNRTYKYRLRPNKRQAQSLDILSWQARTLYNAALEQRISVFRETQKGIHYPEQWSHFRDERKKKPETYGLLNATSVQQMLRRLDKSFKAFFRGLKAGGTAGFPRYKGYSRFKSVEYRYGDGCKVRKKENGQVRFYLQKVGEIKVIYHRPIPQDAEIKHVVVKRNNDRWYVCLMLVIPEREQRPIPKGSPVGIDMGLKSLLATSDGNFSNNPRWLRQSQSELRIAQRKVARRQKGGSRWRKAVRQVARKHEKIANQRLDYWHKICHDLAQNHSLIAIEDLNLKFMNRNSHLAFSAYDAGFGWFQRLLAYKVENTGCQLVVVNPAYTSQECCHCGTIVKKGLSVRIHHCPNCGLKIDRDVNAARIVLLRAFKALGLSVQDLTWAVAPCVS